MSKDLIEQLSNLPSAELFRLLGEGSLEEQRQAAIELGDRGEQRAYDSLLSLLQDAPPGVADGAALGLAELGDTRAVGPLLTAIRERRRSGIGTSPLVWAVITLDPRQAVGDLAELLLDGSYMETDHATVGLRMVWDDLPPNEQAALRTRLRRRRDDPVIEDWRADFLDEILLEGGWTPEEWAWWESGE